MPKLPPVEPRSPSITTGSSPESPGSSPARKRWSTDERRFVRMNAALLPVDEIASALGRTTTSVLSYMRAKRMRRFDAGRAADALDLERSARLIRRP